MKKKFNQGVLLCYIPLLLLLANMAYAQSDYTTIINNITPALKNVGGTSIANTATSYMATQNPDGSWPDIAYATGAPGDVPFSTHLTRLFQYSQAYTISGSSLVGNVNLFNHIALAIEYWNNHIHNAGNWWYDQINYPQLLGQTLILMRGGSQSLSITDSTNAMNYLASREHPSNQVGANRVDESLHWLYRGALTADATVVSTAVTQAGSTLNLVSSGSEGINYDYSFLQHGPELLTMAYGSVLLTGTYKIANYIKNTSYNFSSAQMQNAYVFLHYTCNGAVRGRYKDFSLTGRGISRANELNQNQSITALAMKADTSHYAALREDSLRLSGAQPPNYNISTPYHLHYWAGDYTLHNRPNYSFSVRSVSTRTARSESINGENLLGTFLTDGATNIRVNGNEYYNIFPVWDWNLIPGVTMRQFATPQTNPNGCCSSSYWGNQAYVGGVSDSAYGCSANYMNYYNVAAKKAWFFFDDEVVCLGAGITSTSSENVATSVNQCLLDGNVSVNSGGAISNLGAQTQTSFTGNLQWALHDSVGYFFPAAGNVIISNQSQTGSWSTINTGGSTGTLTKDVFKMWIDHGAAPSYGSYTYIVVPNMTTTSQMTAYNQANITVITNTVSFQAVKHEGLKILQAIVRATGGGTITDPGSGFKITVDQPCAVMVKNIGSVTVDVSIADPAQTATVINVGITFPGSDNVITTAISMPAGNYKGSSVVFHVSAAYPYCAASGGTNGTDRYITSLSTSNSVNDINFTGSAYPANGYGLYTADTITVMKGSLFTLNMVNSASTKWSRVKVYADWNGNNDFTTVGDTILSLGAANQDNSATVLNISSSVAVPLDAITSITRMRVRFFDAANNDPGSCGQVDYTTTQDFCLRILPPASPDSIIAIEDSYVRDGTYANTNFGTSTSLQIKNDVAAGYSRQVYLKFDLQNVSRPVTNAKLRLKIASAGVTANTTQWAVNQCSNNTWTQTGITWNNKPATGAQIAIIQGQSATGLTEWDITNAVNAATGNLLTLQIVSTVTGSTTDATFNSSEIVTGLYKPLVKFIYGAAVTDSLTVVADAFVKSGTANQNSNFGLNGYLASQSSLYESYLRFDLHGLSSNMITARLRLYSLAGASTQWQLYKVNDNTWTETGITWVNKPAAGALLSTITAPPAAGYVYWDIFNELKYNMPADSIVSVKLVASANVYSSFASRQASTVNQRPVIVFDTPVQQFSQLAQPGGVETRLFDHPLTDNKARFINIYPNPAINNCLIQSAKNIRSIIIYNVTGERIKNISGLNTLQYNLSMQDVKSGIYFIKVKGDNWTAHEKIIIQQD